MKEFITLLCLVHRQPLSCPRQPWVLQSLTILWGPKPRMKWYIGMKLKTPK